MLLKRKLKQWFAVTLLCATPFATRLAAQTAHGTSPRPAAKDYAAQASHQNIQIGASLLTKKELKNVFYSDVNRCCVVVEAAFYPETKSDFVNLSLDNFVLRESSEDKGVRASTPDLVAAQLQPKPSLPSHRPEITTESGIGYGRPDPTAPRGRYEEAGVGVKIPTPVPKGTEPPNPAAGKRQAAQDELTNKSLPEINTNEPVAGYLYFSVPSKKKSYELVYTMGNQQIVLSLK
jgi:hypothetical protein